MFSQKKKKKCTKHCNKEGWANSVDPDQTAPKGAVWSGSTLFAILSVLLETFKDNQTDLVKFYVHYVQSPNIVGNYGIILHKKNVKKKKKKKNPCLPYLFFLKCYPKHTMFYLA